MRLAPQTSRDAVRKTVLAETQRQQANEQCFSDKRGSDRADAGGVSMARGLIESAPRAWTLFWLFHVSLPHGGAGPVFHWRAVCGKRLCCSSRCLPSTCTKRQLAGISVRARFTFIFSTIECRLRRAYTTSLWILLRGTVGIAWSLIGIYPPCIPVRFFSFFIATM